MHASARVHGFMTEAINLYTGGAGMHKVSQRTIYFSKWNEWPKNMSSNYFAEGSTLQMSGSKQSQNPLLLDPVE